MIMLNFKIVLNFVDSIIKMICNGNTDVVVHFKIILNIPMKNRKKKSIESGQ